MVVVYDTSIATDGHIDTCLTIVVVTRLSYVDDCRSLSTSDALLLAGDTDRATTDADLDEVCASLYEVAEAVLIDYIACTYDDAVAILLTYPSDGLLLPCLLYTSRCV